MTKSVTARTILDLIDAAGYKSVRTNGQHHYYSKGKGSPTLTVSWANLKDTIPVGTARSIVESAGEPVREAFNRVMRGAPIKKEIKTLKAALQP